MRIHRYLQRILRFVFCLLFVALLNYSPVKAQPIPSGSSQAVENPVSSDPDAPGYLQRLWTIGTWFSESGLSGLSIGDYDRDGAQEILDAGRSRWKVFSYSVAHQRYEVEYISKYYIGGSDNRNGIGCAASVDLGPGNGYRIFVTSIPNRLEVYDGASRRLIASAFFPLDADSTFASCARMIIQDVDRDGAAEIVARSKETLAVINALTYEIEWLTNLAQYGNTGAAMVVGNTDGDPALEIVLNDRMIDGITHQTEWQPVKGIGQALRLADIDGDGKEEVIAVCDYYNLAAYDADTQLYKWIINSANDAFDQVTTADIDDDGVIEIITGNNQWGAIRSYDSASQAVEWQIQNPGHGTANIVIGDSDADGVKEVIWGAGYSSSGQDRLYIGDTVKHAIKWKSPDSGYYSTIDAGDIDADGRMEIAASACYLENGMNGTPVVVFDAATKEPEWAGPFTALDEQIYGCATNSPLLLAGIDKDPALEILLPVKDKTGAGGIAAYDGKTHNLDWEWYLPQYTYYEFDQFRAADVDRDGQVEVIAAGSSQWANYPSPYIYIFDPSTNTVEWKSPVLLSNSSGGENAQVKICNLDGDTSLEIIANVYPLWVFDGKTHTQQWKKDDYNATAFDCGDFNQDGLDEVIAGKWDANIDLLNGQTGELIHRYAVSSYDLMISTLKVADIERDGQPEILAEDAESLLVYSLEDDRLNLIWQSQPVGLYTSPWTMYMRSDPSAIDLDGDGLMEILAGSSLGASLFRYNPQAAQNLPLTASFTTDRPFVITPGSQLNYQATLTNQSTLTRDFHVTIPLMDGSLVGTPTSATGSFLVSAGTLEWTLSLAPYTSGELNFTLAVPLSSPDGAAFAISAHFETAGFTEIIRTATVSIDSIQPQSSIIQPSASTIVDGSQATLRGTSVDDHAVTRVEISVDDGDWTEAQGTNPWMYTWSLPGDGLHNIRSRAIDIAGNMEEPSSGIDLYVSNQGPVMQAFLPAHGSSEVWEGQPVNVQFNIPVRPETLSIHCDPEISFKFPIPGNNATALTLFHSLFPLGQTVTCTVTAVQSTQGNSLETPVEWSFSVSPTTNRVSLPFVNR